MKKYFILLALTCIAFTANAQTQLTTEELDPLYTTSTGSHVSIHDPSVVFRDGMFYIWGSHLGCASSEDLITLKSISESRGTFMHLDKQGDATGTACTHSTAFNTQQVTKVKNYLGEEVDMPNFDGQAYCSRYASNKSTWIDGVMWAPDIIWNEQMQKWCMYLSLDGDNWSSVIILLTSDNPTSGFTYQAPIVMSGFNGQTYSGVSAPDVSETDLEIATGETSLPTRYRQSSYGTYWPNCIDPCVFYDEEGELWMTYGSWSGGIFMLKLDKETGLRDYTYIYESDYDSKKASGTSDPYFGKKIGGGYYVSGEGSYVQHIGDYYYIFISYGEINPYGGYDMRIFRSESPDGPYVDGTGVAATYTSYQLNFGPGAGTNRGMHLMGAYNYWGCIQNNGECAQGHNSACQDDKGRSFVVYHTKFNDGTVGHQVRIHQLFVNERGWLVAAPFIYQGEETTDEIISTTQVWTVDELVGDYYAMVQPYRMDHENYEEMTPSLIHLGEDGTVTGEMSGTWSITEGTGYVKISVDGGIYYGVMCEQSINGSYNGENPRVSTLKAIAFTATSDAGVPLWGYKLQPDCAIAYNYKNMTLNVTDGQTVTGNISIMTETDNNVVLSWLSSDPDIISETGKYNPIDEDVDVTLSAYLTCGDYYWTQQYNVTAQKATTPDGDYMTGMIAYYNFDEDPTYNQYKPSTSTEYDKASYTKAGNGEKPTLEEDYDRFGLVAHVNYGEAGQNSYVRIPNPLCDYDDIVGFTVSAWIKRTENDAWGSIWGFYGSTSTTSATGERLFLTGNTYIGYSDGNDYTFDINYPSSILTTIPVGEWTLVTVTVGEDHNVRIYTNGSNRTTRSVTSSDGGTKVGDLHTSDVVAGVSKLRYFYLGNGSLHDGEASGSADFYVDDLMIFDRELSSNDVRSLYTMENRVTDFTIGENGTAVEEIAASPEGVKTGGKFADGIYDLTGRRISKPTKSGIYIENGKKVLK